MSDLVFRAELEMAATPEQVWEGLTNPALTQRYYFGLAIDTGLQPGKEYAYRGTNGEAAQSGSVLEAVAPRRLRLTSTVLFSPEFREDPPHQVTWEVEPISDGRSRVRVTVDGFASETATYQLYAQNGGVVNELRGLSTVVDRDVMARLARLDHLGDVVVKELTPDMVNDFLSFFDRDAFADNPGWSSCYCMEKHVAAEEWGRRTGADNRRDQEARIRSGTARGLLAYVDGRPVGWCNAGPRRSMIGQDHLPDLRTEDPERVGAIVCFVIAAQYRRHGVARQLLEAACDSLARQGFAFAEAYPAKQGGAGAPGSPVPQPQGGTPPSRQVQTDAQEYRGPLQLYLDAGFRTYRDTPRWAVVRKELAQT